MAVYVDDMRRRMGRLVFSHMIADTRSELYAMVDAIGVDRKRIQYPGRPREHFDVGAAARQRAVKRGAIQVGTREIIEKLRARRVSRYSDCPIAK